MPASTGTAGRAGSPRAVQATASASASRSTWIFTGSCLLLRGNENGGSGPLGWRAGMGASLRAAFYGGCTRDEGQNVVVVGTVDPGDSGRYPSLRPIPVTTGPVRGRWQTGDELWTLTAPGPFSWLLPPGTPALSAGHPKGVHRDIHSLCVPIVTAGTDTWSVIRTAPAA